MYRRRPRSELRFIAILQVFVGLVSFEDGRAELALYNRSEPFFLPCATIVNVTLSPCSLLRVDHATDS